MTQYTNESLFDVISMIANNEITKLNFDITLICTIVDNSRSSMGWYTVTDGSVRFDAYSEDTKLKNKDSVRVQVPRGDMSGRKYILGKAAAEDTNKPVSYISPSERIVDLTSNLYINTQEVKFLANSEITEIQLEEVDVSSKNIDTNIYDTINLGFDVKTQFINTSLSKGNYGVILAVAYQSKIKEKSLEYRRYVLDSQEFLGNPYSFLLTERQEVLFKIGLPDHRVKEIQLGCYQKNNFSYTDSSGDDILINKEPAEGFYDIILSNFYVSFGNELSKIEDNTVKITTFDDTVYEIVSASAQPKCHITWYNKDENNKYIGFSDGRPIINSENNIDTENAYSEFEYIDKNSIYNLQYNFCAFEENEAGTAINFPLDENGLFLKDNMVKADEDIVVLCKGASSIKTESSAVASELSVYLDKMEQDLEDLKTRFRQLLFGTTEQIYYNGFTEILKEANKKCHGKTYLIPNYVNPVNAKNIATQVVEYAENLRIDLNGLKGHTSTDEDVITALNKFKTTIADTLSAMIEAINSLSTSYFLTSLAEDNNSLASSLMATNYFNQDYLYIDYQEYAANRYNIYWYKANAQEIAPDPFGGFGWTRIPELDNKGLPVGKDFTRLGAEAFYTKLPSNVSKQYAEFEFIDGYAAQEKIKAVIVYNHNYYSSNILEFENKSPIVDKTMLLSIQHGNFSQDMFQIYSDDYQIVNSIDASRNRKLKLKVNQEDFDWLGAKITWTIPTAQTQLVRCDKEMSDKGYTQENDNNSSFVTYSLTIGENHYQENALDEQFITFVYKVSGHFSPRNINNTITCAVVLPNGEALTAEKVLNFTAFGTNGSKYNLFFEPLNGYQYPIIPGTNNSVDERVLTIAPKLYDADGYEVSFITDAIEVKNYNTNDIEVTMDNNSNNITFQLKEEQTEYYLVPEISIVVSILSVDTTKTTDPNVQVMLTKQYPIAIGHYHQYEGISKVVYNVLGSDPKYYNQGCYLYDMGTNQQKSYSCELKDLEQDSKDTSLKLITTTDNKQYVKAASMYIKTEKSPKWVLLFKDNLNNIIFCQPIPIMQDNFTSKLLNDWDGGTEVGKDTIMSNLVGAGSKNASGEFSGVLMGEVKRAYEDQGLSLKHGLFGYQNNNLNFQLTADGILKLGNNTSGGQIIFDGSETTGGYIVSNNYLNSNGTQGMKITLKDGHIDAYNFKLTSKNILIDSNPDENGYYFQIKGPKSSSDSTLVNIFSVNKTDNDNFVSLAGWTVDNNSIRFGGLGQEKSMWLCSSGTSSSANIANSGNINGWNITCGPNFGVNKNGNVYLSGKISATSGKIGNWEITELDSSGKYGGYLRSVYNNNEIIISAPSTRTSTTTANGGSTSDQVITIGEANAWTNGIKALPFALTADGSMYATKGEIGGWKINNQNLISPTYKSYVYTGNKDGKPNEVDVQGFYYNAQGETKPGATQKTPKLSISRLNITDYLDIDGQRGFYCNAPAQFVAGIDLINGTIDGYTAGQIRWGNKCALVFTDNSLKFKVKNKEGGWNETTIAQL